MSSSAEATNVLLGKSDSLHQEVLSSFPLCDLTEGDLIENPQFCKLLAILAQHVDQSGLTVPLKTELEKAEQKLKSQRRQWLRFESLYRSLQEMVQDQRVRKHHATVPLDQTMFCETMERCLLMAQCVRQLDPSSTTNQDQPSVLGLSPEHVMELMPSEKNVQRMKQSVPQQLEKHLKDNPAGQRQEKSCKSAGTQQGEHSKNEGEAGVGIEAGLL
uniref:HAUS augmin-like complex, subunit 4 n=1 Tax=Gouania willdenowi TaxID=441366 RepID=A0A8C5DKV4_GOUWI